MLCHLVYVFNILGGWYDTFLSFDLKDILLIGMSISGD